MLEIKVDHSIQLNIKIKMNLIFEKKLMRQIIYGLKFVTNN